MAQVGRVLKGEKVKVVARQKVSAFIEVAVAVVLGRRRRRGVLRRKWRAAGSFGGAVPRDVADAGSASPTPRWKCLFELNCRKLMPVSVQFEIAVAGRLGHFSCKHRGILLIEVSAHMYAPGTV